MESNTKLSVLYLEAGQCARMVEIDDTLEAMQDLVKGPIEEYMPFEDDIAIICNGDFFIAYAPIESESFLPLPPGLEQKYKEKFEFPEQVFRTENGLKTMPYEPKGGEKVQGYER